MQAIETAYKGRLFRSRLEARWAVFFDAMKMQWQYEPEGYKLSDGTCYLPDFKITTPQGQTRWFEIKPLGTGSDRKLELFSKSLDRRHEMEPEDRPASPSGHAFLAAGSPLELLEKGMCFCPRCGSPLEKSDVWPYSSNQGDGGYHFLCYPCDMETECGGGNPTYSNGVRNLAWTPHKGTIQLELSEVIKHIRYLNAAAEQAQMARFEHGQSGYRKRVRPRRRR